MSDLPAHVRRDLDRAANGVGRVATAAHPDCVCGSKGKPKCPQHRPEKGQKQSPDGPGTEQIRPQNHTEKRL